MSEFKIINDGYYYIDAGAYFGITPKAIWQRYFNDNNNRIRLGLNILYFKNNNYNFLIDSGIGNKFDEKFVKIFEPDKSVDAEGQLSESGIKNIDFIILSHMHFDHSGHAFSSSDLFSKSVIICQEPELKAYKNPNDFTRGSYVKYQNRKNILTLDGSRRISSEISVIYTGGHSFGHQIIKIKIGNKRYIYGGDLFPSAFHVKPNHLTAIDVNPIQSMEMKKKILKMAISERAIMIFNHDTNIISARISGTPERPEIEQCDI
ncbi:MULTISPECIES: MBL fold metallo-hydrolase [unclassified Acidiplasma]|uniref:MBL fold metallo-hydrolase n=1 Tax=unclassified Acidiplasma TaxID=2641301 RepID=UPI0005E97519|nr:MULTISPECIES: MBL fold metallo-hydrolase [unclassified Acidiplasma]KJE49274.1 metal-dependent hydrolase [Acidiplasma sp. MBA-1]WMT54750.1 MAG: MBL fold metallo-hydrolase [Acidiplasma sp.]